MSERLRQHRKRLTQSLTPFIGEETKLLHLHPDQNKNEKIEAISIALNLTYCLFLFRLKERSSIEKGLSELKHLLFFQSPLKEFQGNFPTYLHQYPFCDRQFEVLDCLFPLFWILKDFHSIMDLSLQKQIEESVFLALNSLQDRFLQQNYSFRLTLQLASLFHAYGQWYQNESWVKAALSTFESLSQKNEVDLWSSPRELSKLILACSLMEKQQLKRFSFLLDYFKVYWHEGLLAYQGPSCPEFFVSEDPEFTLYHLLMEYKVTQEISKKASFTQSLYAELFLESTFMDELKAPSTSQSQLTKTICQKEDYALSWINQPKEKWVKTGGVYPFKLLFLDSNKCLHTFVLQMGSYVHIQKLSENEFIFEFEAKEEEELEIEFFWDLAAKASIHIGEQCASMFEANQVCSIQFDTLTVSLQIKEGFENMWGHLVHKNRRSQLKESLHHSFDKHLYYRSTVSYPRNIKCHLFIEKI